MPQLSKQLATTKQQLNDAKAKNETLQNKVEALEADKASRKEVKLSFKASYQAVTYENEKRRNELAALADSSC